MLDLALTLAAADRPTLLAVGCHSDDIEIGCGGTVLWLTRTVPGLDVTWIVLCADGERADEARAGADRFLRSAGSRRIVLHRFRDGFLPYHGAEVKEAFEELRAELDPDLVLTHTRDDLHQDHRLACELTWNTFRNHLVLEYEIPKYDGDLGRPNVFLPLSQELAEEKVDLLLQTFASQARKHWFDEELFLGLMRLRGVECASASGYAEAFHGRKLRLGPARGSS